MPKNRSSYRVRTTCAIFSCLAVGLIAAPGATALETRSALAEARAAAESVNAERDALDQSLMRAEASIRASGFAPGDVQIAQAAAEVDSATVQAVTATTTHQAVLSSAESSDDAQETLAPDPSHDPDVAQVLDGVAVTPADAHEATVLLDQARQDLDAARVEVDNEVDQLEQVRDAVLHQQTLEELDAAVDDAEEDVATARSDLEAVDGKVSDSTTVTKVGEVASMLEEASEKATHINRDDPDQVSAHLADIASVQARFDHRIEALVTSHEQWVATKNLAITQSNESVLLAHEGVIERAFQEHQQANRDQAATHSNGWSGRPAGIQGSNGRLSTAQLCELDFAPQHRLQCDAAAALSDANAQFVAETGDDLVLTDSYRSYSLQARTRALKPRTAAPAGKSNHGWGMAVDMDRESAKWLTDNGADYGWVHPEWAHTDGIRPEWWHLEYVATEVGTFDEPTPTGVTELVTSVFEVESIDEDSDVVLADNEVTS